jgi:hypothetical protein
MQNKGCGCTPSARAAEKWNYLNQASTQVLASLRNAEIDKKKRPAGLSHNRIADLAREVERKVRQSNGTTLCGVISHTYTLNYTVEVTYASQKSLLRYLTTHHSPFRQKPLLSSQHNH